ncbi:hypothetical protein BTJ48_04482 [Bacillus mycoides]|nr:hypothetical protein BTJ48_04482 [Bacillus mycoides]
MRAFLQFCHFVNIFIALPFAIFFGKHSELRERALQNQLQRSSALNLLIITFKTLLPRTTIM